MIDRNIRSGIVIAVAIFMVAAGYVTGSEFWPNSLDNTSSTGDFTTTGNITGADITSTDDMFVGDDLTVADNIFLDGSITMTVGSTTLISWRGYNDGHTSFNQNGYMNFLPEVKFASTTEFTGTMEMLGDMTFNTGVADLGTSGFVISLPVAVNVAFGDALYAGAAVALNKAKADGSGTLPCEYIATESCTAGAYCDVMVLGSMRDDSWNWTPGDPLFVAGNTAGALTQTAPTCAGCYKQAVGLAITADIIWWQPSLYYELVNPAYQLVNTDAPFVGAGWETIGVQTTTYTTTMTFPPAILVAGKQWTVKDISGQAASRNITMRIDGTKLIDGDSTLVMSTNWQSVDLFTDGTNLYVK